ncbi:hypothetical protein [Peribacillus tepidiphilus]|uniref:hypothetical protein n=1 Tax=Peribacillus tepidiphilus TaxID=2652445 RepID=UPI0035B5563D
MMLCEWKPFSTDMKTYSQEEFEEMVGDEFEAMMFVGDDEIPSFIWTVNYVCIIKKNARIINDISITKIPRNPVCE